jgi:hypothetical protein
MLSRAAGRQPWRADATADRRYGGLQVHALEEHEHSDADRDRDGRERDAEQGAPEEDGPSHDEYESDSRVLSVLG